MIRFRWEMQQKSFLIGIANNTDINSSSETTYFAFKGFKWLSLPTNAGFFSDFVSLNTANISLEPLFFWRFLPMILVLVSDDFYRTEAIIVPA